jgi:hypothetical protein
MHDGIELEALGVPTAVIVTTEFVREAKVQRAALGMQDIVPAVIQHPLSSLTEAEIKARAEAVLPQVLEAWRGTLKDAD